MLPIVILRVRSTSNNAIGDKRVIFPCISFVTMVILILSYKPQPTISWHYTFRYQRIEKAACCQGLTEGALQLQSELRKYFRKSATTSFLCAAGSGS